MIVIYSWKTSKHLESTTHWKGIFLFGIIPLAIWTTGKTWRIQ